MKVIERDIWVCEDCMFYAVNDDLPPDSSKQRDKEIQAGVFSLGSEILGSGLVSDFSNEVEFECRDCGHIGNDFRLQVIDEEQERVCPQCKCYDMVRERESGEDEFSNCDCGACGTNLAGARYRFAILGE